MPVELSRLTKKHKHYGCWVCEHNPEGVCEKAGKEIPMAYAIMNGSPRWCPKGK